MDVQESIRRRARARFPRGVRLFGGLGVLGVLVVVCVSSAQLRAQFQMPDMKQMSGIPRPVDDLPTGSLSVRLIRGDLSHNITNHPVELHVGDKVLTAKTDENGRAQFDKLPAGTTLKAVADVDGEHLESQEFPAPGQGGVRLMLVATDKSKAAATEPSAPPTSGQVVLGGDSRIVIEPGDETLQVYYLLDIENRARAPVNTAMPFAFEMPAKAVGTTLLEGSSPLATVKGTHVRVNGPFPPGRTMVQLACELPVTSGSMDITQIFPATFERLAVLVKKVGDTTLTSSQLARQQEFPNEGETIIAGTGDAVAAGQPIVLSLADLPHHSAVPRWIALTLAAAILAFGAWAAQRRDDGGVREAERRRLIARREKLFGDLVRLEHDHRSGRVDPRRYAERRADLVTALEQVYGALDDATEPAGVAA